MCATPIFLATGRLRSGGRELDGAGVGPPLGGLGFGRLPDDMTIANFFGDTRIVLDRLRSGGRDLGRAKVRPFPGGLAFGRLLDDRATADFFGDTQIVWGRLWSAGAGSNAWKWGHLRVALLSGVVGRTGPSPIFSATPRLFWASCEAVGAISGARK